MDKQQKSMTAEDIITHLRKLEKRVIALEKNAGIKVKRTRRAREYTVEEKAAIRARLKAGQETAKKKRETEAKAGKKTLVAEAKAVNHADKK